MKKLLFLALISILFILVIADLHAQIPNTAKFYTLPVRGAGSNEAKSFIYDRINYEIAFQDYLLLWGRRGSDYIIRGTIHEVIEDIETADPAAPDSARKAQRVRNTGNRREFISWEVRNPTLFYDASSNKDSPVYEREFVLILKLADTRTNKVIDEKQLVFNHLNEDLERGINQIMTDFFMGRLSPPPPPPEVEIIPAYIAEALPVYEYEDEEAEEEENVDKRGRRFSDDWRDKFLFIKGGILWSPRENLVKDEYNYLNLGVSLALEFQYLNFLSVEFGVQLIQETSGGEELRDVVLDIPIALKFILKPGKSFMIGPYGGASYRYLTLLERVEPSEYSFFGGIEINIKTGSGIFVIDPRIVFEYNTSHFGPVLEKKRRMLQVGLGYKAGFFTKLAKKEE